MFESQRGKMLACALVVGGVCGMHAQQTEQWPTYGGDPGGQRYSASAQITKANVKQLRAAWTFHSGSLVTHGRAQFTAFESTPILFRGTLYVASQYNEVIALDPVTGAERWRYDPTITRDQGAGILTSRGVAGWASTTAPAATACATRIFDTTLDARLIAIDAATGKPCADFGVAGAVDLLPGVVNYRKGDAYYDSSPATVIGDTVVVGSSISDNNRVDIGSGVVRGFDAVTGKQVWAWDPIPWAAGQAKRTGAANAWSVLAADPALGLVYVPTGAASPDFYGGERPGDDHDANSVVALDGRTGHRVWGFQVVHHDLWDYDVASEPLLFTFRGNVPAVAITTKQGLIFVLDRRTGAPLYPVTEKPVPTSDIVGETAWPTQPFQEIASLSPLTLDMSQPLGASAEDDASCRRIIAGLRYDGIYTPPSLRGSMQYPGNLGGVNWGGASFDPVSGILYANTNRYAFSVRLTRRPGLLMARFEDMRAHRVHGFKETLAVVVVLLLLGMLVRRRRSPGVLASVLAVGMVAIYAYACATKPPAGAYERQHFGHEIGEQLGTPYRVERNQVIAPKSGNPCTPQPWGAVSAVNLNTGQAAWQAPLGTKIAGRHTGTVNLGGDVVTAGGLVFTAASEEPLLRAFDSATGEELWKGALPVPAQATPMSYTVNGRQYVVTTAGGHGVFGTAVSDAVVAFALPVK